ncbi:MAG: chromosome segregation protein SMC [Pseudomonadota bacterium]
MRDRDLGQQDRLDALRAFLGAITPEDLETRGHAAGLAAKQKAADQEARHLAWRADRLRAGLIEALGLREEEVPPGRFGIEPLRRAVRAQAGRVGQGAELVGPEELAALRARLSEAEAGYLGLAERRAAVAAQEPILRQFILLIQGELSALGYSRHEAEHPTCPVCDVPIDRALAEGCGLAARLPDLGAVRRRHQRLELDLEAKQGELLDLGVVADELAQQASTALAEVERLRDQVRAAEHAREAHSAEWYRARRLLDDVGQLEGAFLDLDQALAESACLGKALEGEKDQAATLRYAQADVFERLSRHFAAIVRLLVGPAGSGSVALTGQRLELAIQMGGDRSTAAIDSLKVLAFDLAALALAIEGRTAVPAFLLHDSPREADLGLSAYHALFDLVRSLEAVGGRPLFQYIITTTTPPPPGLRALPWLRLTLHGAPAEARLLGRDL